MDKFKVVFEPMHVTVQADPNLYPYGREGLPGSVLDIALAHGVDIKHACGGEGVCGTCRILVEEGIKNLSQPDDDELDVVDQAPGSRLNSRLACRAVVNGDVTVTVPDGDRNDVSQKP